MIDDRDPLAEQMRREALANRPAFSSSLHERIFDRIDEERTVRPHTIFSMRWLTAAAAIAIVGGVTAAWMFVGRHESVPNPQVVVNVPQVPRTVTVDLHGLLYAEFSSSGWVVQSPVGSASISKTSDTPKPDQAQPPVVPASPEWLLAQLQAPTSSAKLALADVIPPQVLELAGWSKAPQ